MIVRVVEMFEVMSQFDFHMHRMEFTHMKCEKY